MEYNPRDNFKKKFLSKANQMTYCLMWPQSLLRWIVYNLCFQNNPAQALSEVRTAAYGHSSVREWDTIPEIISRRNSYPKPTRWTIVSCDPSHYCATSFTTCVFETTLRRLYQRFERQRMERARLRRVLPRARSPCHNVWKSSWKKSGNRLTTPMRRLLSWSKRLRGCRYGSCLESKKLRK